MTQPFVRRDRKVQDCELPSPAALRLRANQLIWLRNDRQQRQVLLSDELQRVRDYLGISDKVTLALDALNQQLFKQLLTMVEEKLTIALQEVLDQPISFHAGVDFKRGVSVVDFWIERDGNVEDVYRGQGGSVANILSVGLRMFALTTLNPSEHQRFLVLDEQDCWLRPEIVPKLVKIVHDAGTALNFQVLMISHHDTLLFEKYADKMYRLTPGTNGAVHVEEIKGFACEQDPVIC